MNQGPFSARDSLEPRSAVERPSLELPAVTGRSLDPGAIERARVRMRSLRRLEDDQRLMSRLREQLGQLVSVDWVERYALDSTRQLRRLGGSETEVFGCQRSSLETVLNDRRAQLCASLRSPALPGDERAIEQGMQSCLRVPLLVQDELVGALVVYASKPGAYDQHAAHSIALVTDLVAHLVLQRHLRETETVLRRWQAQMTAHDKLTSLGQLAAGMAHEINNPAAYEMANLQHGRELLAEHRQRLQSGGFDQLGDQLSRVLSEATDGLQRIHAIVSDLGLFSRGADEGDEAVDLNAVVHAVVNITTRQVAARADLELDLAPLPQIAGSRSRITQILLNLLLNAAQACPIESKHRHRIRIRTRRTERCIEVSVHDDGEGIAPEIKTRIFEPFFTTRPPGQGVGLGLAVSRQLARSMRGQIAFESKLGGGSQFVFTLPLSAAPQHDCPSSGQITAAAVARPLVLLVDDEDAIRKALTRALYRTCDVEAVASADAAMVLLGSGLTPELIVSDLLLPGMSGADLHRFVQRQRPELLRRLLFLTGGAVSPDARDFVRDHLDTVLAKPVDMQRLKSIITRVAGGSSVRRALRETDAR